MWRRLASFDVTDEEFGGDVKTAEFVAAQLAKEQTQPFFLACGIYRPPAPWYNPKVTIFSPRGSSAPLGTLVI